MISVLACTVLTALAAGSRCTKLAFGISLGSISFGPVSNDLSGVLPFYLWLLSTERASSA